LSADTELQGLVLARCRRDPVWWADQFAWTLDTRREGEGEQRLPMTLFRDYQTDLLRLFLGIESDEDGYHYRDPHGELWPLAIDKPRDAGGTETIIKAIVWAWLFEPGANYGVMSRKENEVDDRTPDSLFGRLRWTIAHLPPWMVPHEFRRWDGQRFHRFFDRHMMLYNPTNGNVIAGTSTGGSAFRSRRYRRVFFDEAAAVENNLMVSIMRAINMVSRAPCLLSSPGGGPFERIVKGEDVQTTEWGDPDPKLGWLRYQCTHDMDPRKTADVLARESARMTHEEAQQELYGSFDAHTIGKIWPEFNRDEHVYSWEQWPDEYRAIMQAGRWSLWEAWDFGVNPSLSAVVWAIELAESLYLLDYRCWVNATPETIAKDVAAAGYFTRHSPQGRKPDYRVGDPAMNLRVQINGSWRDFMREQGIDLQSMPNNESREASVMRVRKAIIDGRLYCAPACGVRHDRRMPTLVDSLVNYKRMVPRGKDSIHTYSGRPDVPPEKNEHSHLADCVQYIGDWVWATRKKSRARRATYSY
jgi:hypothetical protein